MIVTAELSASEILHIHLYRGMRCLAALTDVFVLELMGKPDSLGLMLD
jgi:hypothetical protein